MAFPYESKLPHWVNRLAFLFRAEVQQRFAAAGHPVTAEEWSMLMQLWSAEPQTMAQLAERTLRDRTTVTRLIDGMVSKGLLTRTQPPEDRRRVMIGLTEYGRSLEAPLVGVIEPLIAQAVAGIAPDDLGTTLRVLRKVTGNLTAASPESDKPGPQ